MIGSQHSRGSEILLDFHEKPGMKNSLRIATGGGDTFGDNVRTVAPAQRVSFKAEKQ